MGIPGCSASSPRRLRILKPLSELTWKGSVALVALVVGVLAADAQEKVTFADHVLPLVEQHCAKCHNPDKKKGDLDLSSHGGVLKRG